MNSKYWRHNLEALVHHPHLHGLFSQQHIGATVAADPAAAPAMDPLALPNTAATVNVGPARQGELTMSVTEADGRVFTYHSKYDPKGEAVRQVDAVWSENAHILLFGLGLAYALEEVLRRLGNRGTPGRIMVIEPDREVFRALLTHRDLRHILTDRRITWFVGNDHDAAGDRWHDNLDWTAMESFVILDHPPSRTRFAAFFERMLEKIRYLSNRSKGNLVTLMHSGFEFHSNNFLNLARMFPMPGIGRLFGKFAGVPSIVVAAGPSLEKNVHLLHEIKGRFPIIAVDTAFRQLVERGIRPDIVCAADPSYENSLDFVGVEHETEVILAVEPMTHPDILESFQGPQMCMTFGGGLLPLYERFREPIGTLVCWGSIATTTFDLARSLGCDPIVFIGLDLSFQEGRIYARGSYSDDIFFDRVHHLTSLEHENIDYILERGTHRCNTPDGNQLYTDNNMHLYRGWFEDQFRQTKQQVINATEGGVVRNHLLTMPLAEVLRQFSARGCDVQAVLQAELHHPVRYDGAALCQRLAGLLLDIREQQRQVRQGVASIRKLARQCAELPVNSLSGPTREEFFRLLQLHDRMCAHPDLFSWISVHQTRFITRHTMEVKTLREHSNPKAAAWLKLMTEFFAAQSRFHDYQIPFLEQSMQGLKESIDLAEQKEASMRQKHMESKHDIRPTPGGTH